MREAVAVADDELVEGVLRVEPVALGDGPRGDVRGARALAGARRRRDRAGATTSTVASGPSDGGGAGLQHPAKRSATHVRSSPGALDDEDVAVERRRTRSGSSQMS